MYREPATWHALLDRLTDTFCVYVAAKAEAGADAIQLFDSWVGALSVADYEEFVAPYSARILAAVGRPDDPLRHRDVAPAGRDGRRRRRLHRPRLAHPARRGLARRRPRPRRAGQSRPGRPPRPVAPRRVRRPRRPRPRRRPPGPRLQPRPRRLARHRSCRICAGWSSSSTSGLQPHVSDAAVVLMAYGSPDRIEDVPAYYADIRGGRPIAPERLDDLVARYRRLGIEDSNPLNEITERTRAALEARARAPRLHRDEALDAADRRRGRGCARDRRGDHRRPRPRAALLAAVDRGLPPAARGGARRPGRARVRRELAREPGFVDLLADRVRGPIAHVVFTAHSLPARILDEGDPYERQLLESATAIAQAAGLSDWSFSYQSESPTGEPWLGPDILDHLADLHAARRHRRAPLPDRLRRRPPGDPLGSRHRGAGQGAASSASRSADRDAERRPSLRRLLATIVHRALAVPSTA